MTYEIYFKNAIQALSNLKRLSDRSRSLDFLLLNYLLYKLGRNVFE